MKCGQEFSISESQLHVQVCHIIDVSYQSELQYMAAQDLLSHQEETPDFQSIQDMTGANQQLLHPYEHISDFQNTPIFK